MCVIYTNVSFIYAHLGVKFQLQKLCQCKKNDNYKVCIEPTEKLVKPEYCIGQEELCGDIVNFVSLRPLLA